MVLITHQLQYLQHVDQIVILNHGRVEGVGTYDSLCETGEDFAKLLAAEDKEEESDCTVKTSQSNNKLTALGKLTASSTTPLDSKEDKNAKQFEEKKAEGSIGMSLYTKYFNAGGGFCLFYIMLAFSLSAQLLASSGDYFVSFWLVESLSLRCSHSF